MQSRQPEGDQPRRLRRIARGLWLALLFAAALALGLALFLPWDLVWQRALSSAAARRPHLGLTWATLDEAWALGFTLRGLSVSPRPGTSVRAENATLTLGPTFLAADNLDVQTPGLTLGALHASLRLGISPLLTLYLDTGEDLDVLLLHGRTIVAGGSVELARLLPGRGLAGSAEIHADISFDAWGRPPAGGSAEILAADIQLPDGSRARGVKASLALEGERAVLSRLELAGPVPLTGHGSGTLVWGNLPASPFEFRGVLSPGALSAPFAVSRPLGSFF